jgi:hypothetical protein
MEKQCGFQKQYLAQSGRRKEYWSECLESNICSIRDRKLIVMSTLRQDNMTKGGCRKLQPPATAENNNG